MTHGPVSAVGQAWHGSAVNDSRAATARAYQELRRRIVTWQFPPGTRLLEVELATELGMSRTPVHEALHQLRVDGLVIGYRNRGMQVPAWTDVELDEVYRLRAMLESWGARLAARNVANLDLETLRRTADGMTELARAGEPDLDTIADLNIEFHNAILQAAGSERLTGMMSRVVYLPMVYRVFHVLSHEGLTLALDEHHGLIRAFEANDPDWAEALMRAHILAALSALRHASGVLGNLADSTGG